MISILQPVDVRQLLRAGIPLVIAVCFLDASAVCAQDSSLKLWYEQPASKWVEALPIGNGHFGAMVFGGVPEAHYQFNHDTLFSGRPHNYAHPGAVKFLPELRRLLFDGRQEQAHKLGNREFMSINTRGENSQEAYQPFGDLTIQFADHQDYSHYRRELDIDTSLASVSYQVGGVTFRREVFASQPADAIVVRLSADQPGKISCNVSLSSPHKGSRAAVAGNGDLILDGQVERGDTRFQPTRGAHRKRRLLGRRRPITHC